MWSLDQRINPVSKVSIMLIVARICLLILQLIYFLVIEFVNQNVFRYI